MLWGVLWPHRSNGIYGGRGGGQAAGWSNLGHPGASEDLGVWEDLFGKRRGGRNRMGKAWWPDPSARGL